MKSGHTIQLLLSWMITWISAKFQALGMLLLCLLFLIFIDYITGMCPVSIRFFHSSDA